MEALRLLLGLLNAVLTGAGLAALGVALGWLTHDLLRTLAAPWPRTVVYLGLLFFILGAVKVFPDAAFGLLALVLGATLLFRQMQATRQSPPAEQEPAAEAE